MNQVMNNIHILQADNQYQLYLPNGICIGQLVFPPNRQYLQDAKTLEDVTKALAMRWGVDEHRNKK